MKIELRDITIRDLIEGYDDLNEGGVTGYGGRLDIRPPYQREFVYKEKQRAAVIDTVIRGYPLNVMYWSLVDEPGDGSSEFEVIDGQQRTISICQYVDGDFAFNGKYFHNLQRDEAQQILNYELKVYVCTGTDSEKLEWFKTINIAGEKLTDQELRNAVYHGPWLADAKKYFSKNGCPAYVVGNDYMTGSPIRQDYLEKAISWSNDGDVAGYMASHQHLASAGELWTYFQNVMFWVQTVFPVKRAEMKSVAWGPLYNQFKALDVDPNSLENDIVKLMGDPDVTSHKGIYSYLLTGDEKHLSVRIFDERMRRSSYERRGGMCPGCEAHFQIQEMQADHHTPWSKGGKTVAENCVMLCAACNRKKWDV